MGACLTGVDVHVPLCHQKAEHFSQVSVCIYVDVECIGDIIYTVSCILNNVEFRMHHYVSCKVYSV